MTYIYFCKECGFEKEVNHEMVKNPTIKCDKCNKKMSKKITGGIGFMIKGQVSIKDKMIGMKKEEYQQNPGKDPYRNFRD
jgi:putative FmdB family regulatory protein